MPKAKQAQRDEEVELLQKLLVVQRFALGATQDKIARMVGRQKLWVNEIVKGLPKRGANRG